MKLFFEDEAFDGQLQRSVGKADSVMANVGECLAVAAQIVEDDDELGPPKAERVRSWQHPSM
ncbi:MAG: hypothetical protein WKF43_09635 [Acidimicrobiales bacterium]